MPERKETRTARNTKVIKLSDEQEEALEIAQERKGRMAGEYTFQGFAIELLRKYCEDNGVRWPKSKPLPTGRPKRSQ